MDESIESQVPQVNRPAAQRPRRPRAARACDLCRSKKYKCDESYPCSYCQSRNVECVYKGQDMSRMRMTSSGTIAIIVENYEKVATDGPSNSPEGIAMNASSLPIAQHPTVMEAFPTPNSISSWHTREQEVSGMNTHTRDVEFYGSSSSVALLSHVRRTGEEDNDGDDAGALLSSLHNPHFDPSGSQDTQRGRKSTEESDNSPWYLQCRNFIDGFFSAIHYIHPILDKTSFVQRCESLWAGEGPENKRITSFVALYYSILSIGALVGTREDELIDGITNLAWSRKFFDRAKDCCNRLGMVTDLDMVQCYFILAKVCQNELHPHLSYMYVGLAIRTALAMGINREPGPNSKKPPSLLRAETRTWWGLYSLETPDTLGADLYHNRRFPRISNGQSETGMDSEMSEHPCCAIIEHMHLPAGNDDTDDGGDGWPDRKRPGGVDTEAARGDKANGIIYSGTVFERCQGCSVGEAPKTCTKLAISQPENTPLRVLSVEKCLESAKQTIETIYQTYQHSDFFRTWFYNTTYTVFAASIILVYMTQDAVESEMQPLLRLVDMAIEILMIMDECVVALQAAKLLQGAREKATQKSSQVAVAANPGTSWPDGMVYLNHYWGPLNLLDGDLDQNLDMSSIDFDAASLFMSMPH
ncbi:C6 transcription factor [Fusarium subglutinans]|uniref:C6 transcription factor n=1 Tax=Gibberella subglutinans TaxID=42677 RepID=A0A8H5V397_GIBSU|nr:C6 transcription factor [Fusarium subglutinans]KAF5606694.1 C6 transcription factor [Fusarium subglutinans]